MYGVVYEEWAWALEARGNWSQADRAYELGIKRYHLPPSRAVPALNDCLTCSPQRGAAFGAAPKGPPPFPTASHRGCTESHEQSGPSGSRSLIFIRPAGPQGAGQTHPPLHA